MQSIKPEAQSNTDTRRIAGPVARRLSGALPRIAAFVVVVVALCALPFWWFSGGDDPHGASVQAQSQRTLQAEVIVSPTAIPTPERIGYTSAQSAQGKCADDESVIELWRGGKVVGFACNKDMDVDRSVSGGVNLKVPSAEEIRQMFGEKPDGQQLR